LLSDRSSGGQQGRHPSWIKAESGKHSLAGGGEPFGPWKSHFGLPGTGKLASIFEPEDIDTEVELNPWFNIESDQGTIERGPGLLAERAGRPAGRGPKIGARLDTSPTFQPALSRKF
jgi:hypothetical protein